MRGLCPECGQEFAWRDVFFPDRNNLRGFFEHTRAEGDWGWAGAARRLMGDAWRTWWWAMGPWGFYRRVLITHRIVLWRVALWLIFLIAPLHVIAATLAMARVAAFPVAGMGAMGTGAEWSTYLSCWTYPVATVEYMPAPGVIFPPVYPGGPPGVGTAAPPGLAGFWDVNWIIQDTPLYVMAALMMHTTFALMCMALPWTLGAAKVRFGHWARAVVYGLAWLPLLAVFRVGRNAWLMLELLSGANIGMTGLGWGGPTPVRLSGFFPEVFSVLLLGWVIVWWAAVFVRGWRVKQAWGVWAMLGVAAAVAAGGTWMMLDAFWYW